MDVKSLREKYPIFEYQNYEITEDSENIIIKFEFEILGLTKFKPETKILKKNFNWKNINTSKIHDIVFSLGMVEAISYFKATCSPQFIIKCGYLNDVQKAWFKKLFFAGLGEFRYINGINIPAEEFVEFICDSKAIIENDVEEKNEILQTKSSGIIIPVGGGKDSNVTLELLKKYKEDTLCFRIGVNDVSLKCAELAGFSREKVIEVTRTIDKNILDLNKKGFLNGHTPFSAMVAFLTYLTANLLGKKYIALSNEDSANQSNVDGENINHQYSKSFEFEKDIRFYFEQFLSSDVEYFSMLRPITELQIAMLFSKQKQYHKIFKSCNVGSKQSPWVWCCNCPKCLFVYSILSPFLYKDENVEIFGEDLFEKESLKETFVELCGFGETKPFECVGTYEEVRFAISKIIEKLEKQGKKLPYLLDFYKNNYELVDGEFLKFYNKNNFLPEEFDEILRTEIEKFESI
jgi:hypothetical protein